jgi:hypothetical protein
VPGNLVRRKTDRMPQKIGKFIGGSLYVHRNYVPQAIRNYFPGRKGEIAEELYLNALDAIQNTHPEHSYVVVKITPFSRQVSFIASPDFDTASEPTVGTRYLYADGVIKQFKQAKDPWVYHGKHLMVGPGYKGFVVDEEAEWFDYWNKNLNIPHSRIGKKSVWEKVKPKKQKLSSVVTRIK